MRPAAGKNRSPIVGKNSRSLIHSLSNPHCSIPFPTTISIPIHKLHISGFVYTQDDLGQIMLNSFSPPPLHAQCWAPLNPSKLFRNPSRECPLHNISEGPLANLRGHGANAAAKNAVGLGCPFPRFLRGSSSKTQWRGKRHSAICPTTHLPPSPIPFHSIYYIKYPAEGAKAQKRVGGG